MALMDPHIRHLLFLVCLLFYFQGDIL
jgi:hypothetical protein